MELIWVGGVQHHAYDEDCRECYGFFPKKCLRCGGLAHCELIDEDDDNVYTTKVCTGCGEDWTEPHMDCGEIYCKIC